MLPCNVIKLIESIFLLDVIRVYVAEPQFTRVFVEWFRRFVVVIPDKLSFLLFRGERKIMFTFCMRFFLSFSPANGSGILLTRWLSFNTLCTSGWDCYFERCPLPLRIAIFALHLPWIPVGSVVDGPEGQFAGFVTSAGLLGINCTFCQLYRCTLAGILL